LIRSEATAAALIDAAASDFAEMAKSLLEQKTRIRVLLTGGSLGIEFIARVGQLDLDWDRMFLMFSDERFVALEDADRNEHQALSVWPGLRKHLVRFPGPDVALDSARDLLNEQLTLELGPVSGALPVFDLTVLGMGPDAHVASLFPGHERSGQWVVSEDNSPKPPSQRLSLSYQALNRSERLWFLAAGESKLQAVRSSMDASSGLPAARVRGTEQTVWYLDQEITDAL
jgi:6-phosphogluconolactonase